ncbi:hypothetical protein GOZ90_24695 [Agrobacterium vitis]|uniref:Mannose-6-phosphate isomerase n=1 Tax=Agrobacterium vitis TaxID=373 RepID=A0A6L6VJL8_AGRVI|nr:AGE family epimerase/isomerase [Agrobacterium vitis]MUZ75864.1 hypothetical protein [Agrobacterium vitis]
MSKISWGNLMYSCDDISSKAKNLSDINREADIANDWLRCCALPLWSGIGFERDKQSFHEQLDFSLSPLASQRRVMVQARQIVVFSAAYLNGDCHAGKELALCAVESMLQNYEDREGRGGFVFSIDPRTGQLDDRRDLYAHAFVLFSLAWVLRLENRQSFKDAIERTLSFLELHLSDSVRGGYWDSMPRLDNKRSQNPHMHLLEAFIALYETTGERRFLDLSRQLRDLAVTKFLNLETGSLCEYFTDDWTVYPSLDKGIVEPGHLFEWSWLLSRFWSLSGEDQSLPIRSMMMRALKSGFSNDEGRIIDQIDEQGRSLLKTSRSWPHTEALKALTSISIIKPSVQNQLVANILQRLKNNYCPDDLKGGWYDQLNEDDVSVRPNIPASTLYHIYFGITAVKQFVDKGLTYEFTPGDVQ